MGGEVDRQPRALVGGRGEPVAQRLVGAGDLRRLGGARPLAEEVDARREAGGGQGVRDGDRVVRRRAGDVAAGGAPGALATARNEARQALERRTCGQPEHHLSSRSGIAE
jgi:hypothetical protein